MLRLPFCPYHQAAEQPARFGAEEVPVVLQERIIRGDILRELVKIRFAQKDDLLNPEKRPEQSLFSSGAGHPMILYLPQMRRTAFGSFFTSYFMKSADGGQPGVGVLPKNAFGYPKAMLAKPVTGWEKSGLRRRSDGVVLASFFDFGQTIQCGADDVSLFGQPDFCGHGVADLLAAYHQHPAPPSFYTYIY